MKEFGFDKVLMNGNEALNEMRELGYNLENTREWTAIRLDITTYNALKKILNRCQYAIAIKFDYNLNMKFQQELEQAGVSTPISSSYESVQLNIMFIYRE